MAIPGRGLPSPFPMALAHNKLHKAGGGAEIRNRSTHTHHLRPMYVAENHRRLQAAYRGLTDALEQYGIPFRQRVRPRAGKGEVWAGQLPQWFFASFVIMFGFSY